MFSLIGLKELKSSIVIVLAVSLEYHTLTLSLR